MVPTLARMAVIIKSKADTNILTGNYEMAYVCGLLCRLAGAQPPEPENAVQMQEYVVSQVLPNYTAQNEREENIIRMLQLYKPEKTWDDQVRELFGMGLGEEAAWKA